MIESTQATQLLLEIMTTCLDYYRNHQSAEWTCGSDKRVEYITVQKLWEKYIQCKKVVEAVIYNFRQIPHTLHEHFHDN